MKLKKSFKEIFATLFVLSITTVGYAAISSVSDGDSLTAILWNDMKAAVDENTAKLIGITNISGNIGIGTSNPGEKLEVNGAIKFTPNGSTMSKAPRVVYTPDTRSGCPASASAGTDLFSQTISLDNDAQVVINVDGITNYPARVDTYIHVDGVSVKQTLTSTTSASRKPVHIKWAGNLTSGNHTISVRSAQATNFGCGASYGGIMTTIYE